MNLSLSRGALVIAISALAMIAIIVSAIAAGSLALPSEAHGARESLATHEEAPLALGMVASWVEGGEDSRAVIATAQEESKGLQPGRDLPVGIERLAPTLR